MSERRLGRGLESLLGGVTADEITPAGHIIKEVPTESIRPNRRQPRSEFRAQELQELAESLKAVGVLQPLMVRRGVDGYELIAGERRLRAAKIAGLATVPVIERNTNDSELLTLALIENIQREDLNPIEKAKAFKELIAHNNLTQDEAAVRVGKDRSTISNLMRLLELCEPVQRMVADGLLSMGHARALVAVPDHAAQESLAKRVVGEGLSVRGTEEMVTGAQKANPALKAKRIVVRKSAHIRDLEDRIREKFGTKVELSYMRGRGRLAIHFFNDEDLQRILEVLGVSG